MQGKTRQTFYLVLLGVLAAALYFFSGQSSPTPPPAAASEGTVAAHDGEAAPQAASDGERDGAPHRDEAPADTSVTRQTLMPFEGSGFRAHISSLNGGIARLELTEARYRDDEGQPMQLVTTDRPELLPFQFELQSTTNGQAPWEAQRLDGGGVRLHQRTEALDVTRKYEAGRGPYQIWITTTVRNVSDGPVSLEPQASTFHYVAREDEGGGFLAVRSPAISHGLCHLDEEIERYDREDLLEPHTFSNGVDFAGIETTYFLNAMAPHMPQATGCDLRSEDRGGTLDSPHGSLFTTRMRYPETTLPPGETENYRFLAYMGPKIPDTLHEAGHELPQAIDLGFFASISGGLTWLLRAIHEVVGNWGLAIILLTVFVKLVLYPLTEKSFRSMAQIRQLKPEMDKINALYADNREKKGAAIMELYRKHKINPMGGCLPQLLQLPIWFALYTSLSTNVELFRAPFALWWTDLSRPDPFFVLPLALGLLMFLQQKMTPTAMDPAQAKVMMYVMPVMITSFMLFLPAGLGLYMFTNSALSVGQQQLIERRLANAAASAESAPPDSNGSAEQRAQNDDTGASGSRVRAKAKPRKATHRRSRRG